VILEFTGLPGAGKTTSESYIILCYKQRGYQVILRSELQKRYIKEKLSRNYEKHFALRILSNRLYGLLNWKELISAGLGGGIFREVLSNPRRSIFSWLGEDIRLSTYFLQNYASTGTRPSVYFSQEGFVHHSVCFKVFGGVGFPDLPEKLLQKIPSENITILYLKISVDDALDRLWARGIPESWPSRINSKSGVKEILLRFNEAIEGNVEKFQAKGVRVLIIDASLDPQEMESRVREVMDAYIKNSNFGGTEIIE